MDTEHYLFLLVVASFVGYYMTNERKRTRQAGVFFGILAAIVAWLGGWCADPSMPAGSVWFACGLMGGMVTVGSWIVLSVLQVVLSGPFELIGDAFGFVKPRMKKAYERRREVRERHALDKARKRIAELESRPDALPENVDEVTRLAVEWNGKRERVLSEGGENTRQQLNRIDAEYGKQFADLLAKQENDFGG